MLGFEKGFRAMYPCTICKVPKDVIQKMQFELIRYLRTVDNYEKDASTKSHGVRKVCCFNKIPRYHVITNSAADICHDFHEGELQI